MNPRERMLRAVKGRRPDRAPLNLLGCAAASRGAVEAVRDPLRRRLMERVYAESHFSVQVPSHINRFLVTPPQRMRSRTESLPDGNRRVHGVIDTPRGELAYVQEWSPASGTSWMVKYPVESAEDIEKIRSAPWTIPEGLAPPDLSCLPDGFGERGVLETRISTPMVCVAAMMKYESFLELCATDFPLVRELTEICRARILDCLRVLLSKPGIEYVWIGGSEWLTPPMGSPALYDGLVQEQEGDLIRYIHENGGAAVHVHCHGRVRRALARMIERGADFTEPVEPPPDGDITLAQAKELAAGRITLGGNIECRILCNESEQAVERAARAAFEGGKERFVFQPTEGPSPRMSEKEYRNFMRLIDLWEELSPLGGQPQESPE